MLRSKQYKYKVLLIGVFVIFREVQIRKIYSHCGGFKTFTVERFPTHGNMRNGQIVNIINRADYSV